MKQAAEELTSAACFMFFPSSFETLLVTLMICPQNRATGTKWKLAAGKKQDQYVAVDQHAYYKGRQTITNGVEAGIIPAPCRFFLIK
jgi:hypothetical protein